MKSQVPAESEREGCSATNVGNASPTHTPPARAVRMTMMSGCLKIENIKKKHRYRSQNYTAFPLFGQCVGEIKMCDLAVARVSGFSIRKRCIVVFFGIEYHNTVSLIQHKSRNADIKRHFTANRTIRISFAGQRPTFVNKGEVQR